MDIQLAPIVLFVYARPDHTEKCLAALAANSLARSSDLIVYSDGFKDHKDEKLVEKVRQLVRATTGFASIKLIERAANLGLAKNIMLGLSQVFEKNIDVIVLEDDIVCAPGFLTFMNGALRAFKDDDSIWHINGWNYPILADNLPSVYCSRTMNCWGWATWRDRWQYLTTRAEYFMQKWTLAQKIQFNQDGSYPFYSHLISNYLGERRTWAIYWYASIFDANGLCITPGKTLTNEIGSDGSGTHGLNEEMYLSELSQQTSWDFSKNCSFENLSARRAVVRFNRLHFGILSRFVNTLRLLTPWWIHCKKNDLDTKSRSKIVFKIKKK